MTDAKDVKALTAEELQTFRNIHSGPLQSSFSGEYGLRLLATISALEVKVREAEDRATFIDKTWYERYQQVLRFTKAAEAELASFRAGQAAGVEDDPSTGPLNGSFELGDMADAAQMIERISKGENCLIDLTMIYAGFRRSQGSGQVVVKNEALEGAANAPFDRPRGPFAQAQAYHDSLHDDMLATKAASAAEPENEPPLVVELIRTWTTSLSQKAQDILTINEVCYLQALILTMMHDQTAGFRNGHAEPVKVGKRLDRQKIIDAIWTMRVEISGYISKPQQSGELNMAAAIKIATALIAAFDKQELWEGE